MRYLLAFLCIFLLNFQTFSQEKKNDTSIKFNGFIRNDIYLDTYRSLNMLNDLTYFLPNFIGFDANGKEINKQTSASFLSVESRLWANITGPTILGAKSSGLLEADFVGKPDFYLLRLRKAYITLNWEKSTLTIGQNWHPFGGGNVFPTVPSTNNGSPFRPFNRSPQIRYDYLFGNVTTSLSALYQHLYVSNGPLGLSSVYKRDAVVPELDFGVDWSKNGWSIGGNIDYNTIKPRLFTTGNDKKTYTSNEILSSWSYMVYCRFQGKKLMMLFQGYLGQNLTHMQLNSGYGVSAFNPVTGAEKYTNYNGLYSMFNLTYGNKWRPGILLGYAKNLGTSDPLYKYQSNGVENALVWGRSTDTRQTYRFAPFLSYVESNYSLQFEYERTTAEWGLGNMNFDNGLFPSYHNTANNGIRMVLIYNF